MTVSFELIARKAHVHVERFLSMDDPEEFIRGYAAQIRTARSLLGWTRRELAAASCLPHRTIAKIERADGRFTKRTLTAVRVALGVAGVVLSRDDATDKSYVEPETQGQMWAWSALNRH